MLQKETDLGATVLDVVPGVKRLDGPILAQRKTDMLIERDTRYSQLSVELCTQGGALLADILQDGETSLAKFREESREQDLD